MRIKRNTILGWTCALVMAVPPAAAQAVNYDVQILRCSDNAPLAATT